MINNDEESRLLKAVVSTLLIDIWISEFYNDAEDYINFLDPINKEKPRSERDIKRMEKLVSEEKDNILDEIVELLKENNYLTGDIYKTFTLVTENVDKVRELIDNKFGDYRRRLWNVIKPEFPSE